MVGQSFEIGAEQLGQAKLQDHERGDDAQHVTVAAPTPRTGCRACTAMHPGRCCHHTAI